MMPPEFKGILAPPKHSVLWRASQSIVCFAEINNAQCQKTDISRTLATKRALLAMKTAEVSI